MKHIRKLILTLLALTLALPGLPAFADDKVPPAATAQPPADTKLPPPQAPDALGWVGNLAPASGSSTAINSGAFFDVYVQAYKAGVTEPAGRGVGIQCQIYWSKVNSFGTTWLSPAAQPMSYTGDAGNNDQYKGTLGPIPAGLYEFTARCSDNNGASWSYSSNASGNGKITATDRTNVCNGAAASTTIFWDGLGHNTMNTTYRASFGAVAAGSAPSLRLRLRACRQPNNSVSLRVWDDRNNVETWYPLTWESNDYSDPFIGANGADIWGVNLPIPSQPTILYYIFKVTNTTSGNTVYYADDDSAFLGGGWGAPVADFNTAQGRSFQLSVYDPAFTTPAWLKDAVIYQIFPDRFRNDDPGTAHAEPVNGGDWIYGQTVRKQAWSADLCDPRGATCPGEYANQFYGGDLEGITNQLDYLREMGMTTLYLNPIFKAPSNHLYDTQDYLAIDPYFGTTATFNTLATEAHARGMRIILDGVFNHVSSDSRYFDRYSRWDAAGNLISPGGPGTDDDSGACEAGVSSYYNWFYFPDIGNPAKDNGSTIVYCANGAGNANQTYESWYGYSSLPKLQANSTQVRNLIWANGTSSVGPYWLDRTGFAGADGWRFDVGADIDPGLTGDPNNDYWEGFRTATHAVKSDSTMLIEEWGDASPWLLGGEMNSTMNYRFRSAVLNFFADQGFSDNDSNSGSSSGPIVPVAPSQLDQRLKAIQEDYPSEAWYAMMNLLGSHDTNRVRFLLKMSSAAADPAADARAKLKLLGILQFTYPGAPTIYYGDEAGLAPDGVWDGSKWQDDPYNRAPYPWADQGRTPDTDLIAHFRRLAVLRNQYAVLRTGAISTLLTDDVNRIYAYSRTTGTTDLAVTVLNRDPGNAHSVTLTGVPAAFNGVTLYDVMNNGAAYTVSNGSIANVSAGALWGAVLVKGPLPAFGITLSIADDDLATGGATTVSATVTNIAGQPAADGTTVNFALAAGTGTLPAGAATTGGVASVTYTAPASRTTALIRATSGTYAGARAGGTVAVGYSADVSAQSAQQLTIGPASLDAKAVTGVELVKTGAGEPWAAATQFAADPTAFWGANVPPTGFRGAQLSSATNVTQLEVRLYYTGNPAGESALRLWWYDGTQWAPASSTNVNTTDAGGYGGYVYATITSSTTPTLAQLASKAVFAGWPTATFTSVGADDGYILESTETSGVGGTLSSTGTTLRAGDDSSNRQYRSVMSFDTSPLPDTATILAAQLRAQRSSLTGASPFSTHGTLWADVITGAYGGSNALAITDFEAASTATGVAGLSSVSANLQWSSGYLNSTGRGALNKTGRTQFKLRFNLDDDNDFISDYMSFYSGDAATANRPVLAVAYLP
jgi:glycosidase